MQKKLLYPSQIIHRKLPLNYDEMHESKTNFILTEEKIDASHIIEIKNAYVSPFGVVFKNGLVVKESVYSMFKPSSFSLSFYKKILLNKVLKVSGNCVVAHHSYYQNYYHFLLEILPRLFVLRDKAPELKLIINKNIPSFVKEYIDLFGFKEIVFINDDEIAKVENITFSTYLSRGLAYNENVIKKMALWLREKLYDDNLSYAPEKIFISRDNAKYRKTLNEEDVFSFLQKKGFVKFNLDEPNIKAQAKFFKNAKYIIGSHGAGFSNLIFTEHCKIIVDIIHEQHPQDCFYNLSNCFNIDYCFFQCSGTGANTYANNDDIIVDLVKFEKTINKII